MKRCFPTFGWRVSLFCCCGFQRGFRGQVQPVDATSFIVNTQIYGFFGQSSIKIMHMSNAGNFKASILENQGRRYSKNPAKMRRKGKGKRYFTQVPCNSPAVMVKIWLYAYNMPIIRKKWRIVQMNNLIITDEHLTNFQKHLEREEKSPVTVEKYLRDVRNFAAFAAESEITKTLTLSYKQSLVEKNYAVRSINSMLASLNSFLEFLGLKEARVKNLKQQKQIFCTEEKELTKEEYMRLLKASQKQEQLNLVIQTICGTGIRVSELKYFTVEEVQRGAVSVQCKNKTRAILIPGNLRRLLLDFAKKKGIRKGCIFVTRTGKPLDRSNIWAKMKKLCEKAGVLASKVFPHNLRKLFARCFYSIEKDIAKLADILGHSNIETTRIYIMTTCTEHLSKIERLGLVV